jgi:hypothetical protein
VPIKLCVSLPLFLCALNLCAADVTVRSSTELRSALSKAVPGTRILLAPGEYAGGLHFANLRGTASQPIVIASSDQARMAVLKGGGAGIHLTDPAYVEIHQLVIAGWTGNGLSIDDGGSFDTPAHHILIRGLVVTNSGPSGNRDGIKLSGVSDFRVEGCTVEGWGTGGGSGIDMVGCHRGSIVSNFFRHTDTVGSTGVQCKGGTSDMHVFRNRFENAGGRGVNIGGSTGRQFFRPPLQATGNREAHNIRVEENIFIGSSAAMAFVGVDGAMVRSNTIYLPKRWAFRILQETRAPDFVPSRNGEFTDNAIVFHSTQWSEGGVNIGGGTAPETFKFARNRWYCVDQPSRSKPRLPAPEVDGVYGQPVNFRP